MKIYSTSNKINRYRTILKALGCSDMLTATDWEYDLRDVQQFLYRISKYCMLLIFKFWMTASFFLLAPLFLALSYSVNLFHLSYKFDIVTFV